MRTFLENPLKSMVQEVRASFNSYKAEKLHVEKLKLELEELEATSKRYDKMIKRSFKMLKEFDNLAILT